MTTKTGVREYLEYMQLFNADGDITRVESLRGCFPENKDVVTQVVLKSAFDQLSKELKAEKEKVGKLNKLLKSTQEAHLYTAKEINRIKTEIFPNIEWCDCEAPCDCIYPLGWVDLDSLPYHCYGSDIQIEEALKETGDV